MFEEERWRKKKKRKLAFAVKLVALETDLAELVVDDNELLSNGL